MSVRATTVGAALAMLGCLAAGCASGSTGAITDPSASVSIPTAPGSSSAVSPTPSAVPAATFPLTGLGTSSKAAASARVMAAALSASYAQLSEVRNPAWEPIRARLAVYLTMLNLRSDPR